MELDVLLQSESLLVFTLAEDGFLVLLRMVAADTNVALMLLLCRHAGARKLFQNIRDEELTDMIFSKQMTQLNYTTMMLVEVQAERIE